MRSWLFVPGDRPDRFAKAATSGADEVILDLEDAVAASNKESARQEVARWLTDGAVAWVRVNSAGSRWHRDDLAALATCPGLRGVVLPKAHGQATVRRVEHALPGMEILALIESALGIQDAPAIAACVSVCGLAFGSIDFALDIGADDGDDALLFARSALVIAARAAGLPPPIDGVTVETRNTEIIRASATAARRLGFGGKLCIHPAQIEVVNDAFGPDPTELNWAQRVLSAAGSRTGAFAVDGRMIDEPVLARARRILQDHR